MLTFVMSDLRKHVADSLKSSDFWTMVTINSIATLANILATAKCNGQFATITYEKPIDVRVNATDGSGDKRDKSLAVPVKRTRVTYHFGQDYNKLADKILGEDREHKDLLYKQTIVPNLMYFNASTNNYTLAYIGTDTKSEWLCDKATEDYFRKFIPKYAPTAINYKTISVKYVSKIRVGGTEYEVDIPNISTAKVA
jgi:hypothetical protein